MATHPYQADPQSGAGNCVCGAPERHVRHPHTYVGGATYRREGSTRTGVRTGRFVPTGRCTCTRPDSHPIHITKES